MEYTFVCLFVLLDVLIFNIHKEKQNINIVQNSFFSTVLQAVLRW